MHAGPRYTFKEVILWTRRDIYWFLLLSTIPTLLYGVAGWTWLTIPWVPIALIGTAVAFMVGFRNNASYGRAWEARQIYGAIVNSSRAWGVMVRDLIAPHLAKTAITQEELNAVHTRLIHRHLAWLHALRFQLRMPRQWETMNKKSNVEYRQWFTVEEQDTKLEDALSSLITEEEKARVLAQANAATQIIALQSSDLRDLHAQGRLEDFRHLQLENVLVELLEHQGKCERIKNFPYPRQFGTLNQMFTRLFISLVPFGMLGEFAKMGGGFVWLTIPFSALVAWVFNMMERIGEATENPFEGSANDVPITALTRTIEIDLREMLGEKGIPPPLKPKDNILM